MEYFLTDLAGLFGQAPEHLPDVANAALMHGGGAHCLWRCCLGTLLKYHVWPDASLHEPLNQFRIIDVPVAEGLAPNIARRLPQVKFRNACAKNLRRSCTAFSMRCSSNNES